VPLETLDAPLLRRWSSLALQALTATRAEIDALNVYPVPDGDTGTNLLLTWESALAEVADADEAALPRPTDVLRALARGALLGARGNSGVILSEMLRGAADLRPTSAAPADRAAAAILAAALRRAAAAGYGAVSHPVEGTMLSVLRVAAEAAGTGDASEGLGAVVDRAVAGAERALAATPDELPVLRTAGVVDAGGRGIVVLLQALREAITGEPVPASDVSTPAMPRPVADEPLSGPGFEVMYLLEADDDRIPGLRDLLDRLGDSLLVVGGDRLWNVHVHTDDVGAAIEAALDVGRPYRIRVTAFAQRRVESVGDRRVVIAVAAGEELARLLEGSGATVVRHGPAARPATRDLLAAAAAAPGADLVLLPDDPDTRPVAEAAAAELRGGGRRVAVLPTGSPLQVIAALAVHDGLTPFDEAVVRMAAAASGTRTGAVTTAVREALTTAGVCRPGDALGLVEGEVVVIGSDQAEVAIAVAELMLASGGELVSVLPGLQAPADLVGALGAHLRRTHPEVDLEVLPGGQPHYPVLLGVE
jgi:DAK2 domain fusion protein YloV